MDNQQNKQNSCKRPIYKLIVFSLDIYRHGDLFSHCSLSFRFVTWMSCFEEDLDVIFMLLFISVARLNWFLFINK